MIVYLQMIETDEDKSKFEEIYQEYRNLKDSTLFCVGAIVMPKVRVVKNGTS